jgi:hypothetical protein
MYQMKVNNLVCGIDPAFRKKGFAMAMIDYSDKTVNFKVFRDFLAFCSWFLHESPESMTVTVENSNLQNKTFSYYKGSKSELEHISRSVGKNQAISQCTVDLLKTKPNYRVIDISPKQKGKKWSQATAEAFLKSEGLTPNKKRLNQDERDALQIAAKGKQLSIFKT